MCLSRYRGNFQVVTDVHSVHIFLRHSVRTVQVSQQACWLRAHKTQWNGLRLKQRALAAREKYWLTSWSTCLYHIMLIAAVSIGQASNILKSWMGWSVALPVSFSEGSWQWGSLLSKVPPGDDSAAWERKISLESLFCYLFLREHVFIFIYCSNWSFVYHYMRLMFLWLRVLM